MTSKMHKLAHMQQHNLYHKMLINSAMVKLKCDNFEALSKCLGYNRSTISRWNRGKIDAFGLSYLEHIYIMSDAQSAKFKSRVESKMEDYKKMLGVKSKCDVSYILGARVNRSLNYHYARYHDAIHCLNAYDIAQLKQLRGVL